MIVQESNEKTLEVTINKVKFLLPFSQIAAAEYLNRTIVFTLADGEKKQTNTIRTSFSALMRPLLADSLFVRSHHSYVVNMRYISGIQQAELLMQNGDVIPISKQYRRETSARFSEYMQRQGIVRLGDDSLSSMLDQFSAGLCVFREKEIGHLYLSYFNQGLCRLTGVRYEDALAARGVDPFKAVHPDDVEKLRAVYLKSRLTDEVLTGTYRVLKPDGTYAQLLVSSRRVMEHNTCSLYLVYLPMVNLCM